MMESFMFYSYGTISIQPNRHIRERYPRASPLANVLC
jgi:hypothetical protein